MWKDKALFVSDQHDRIKEREKLLGYIVNP